MDIQWDADKYTTDQFSCVHQYGSVLIHYLVILMGESDKGPETFKLLFLEGG